MKQRFSSLDVKIIAHELSSSLTSLRLSNVYDLSSRIFLLKFAKPEHREQVLIDSGFRCHLTSFARATAAAPSPFVARLRKFLKTRRVTAVSQVGTDRIIEITFSDGAYRLFLEFYAGGNIVLTDNELTIIALLRNVSEGAEHEQYRLGLKYNLSLRQNYAGVPPLTRDRLREGLQKSVDRQQDPTASGGKKLKKKAGDALRKALAVSITEYPPVLLDHALQVKGFDKNLQPLEVLQDDALLDKLTSVFDEAADVMKQITSADTATGYIVSKRNKSAAKPEQTEEARNGDEENTASEKLGLLYDDFHPFKPSQLESNPENIFSEYQGFNRTVDEFFSSIEGQKLESKLQEREDNAKRKLDQARQEHAKRIGGLQQVQELNVQKAQAIEANLDRVEEATAAVNGLIAQGMDWVEIGRLIEIEQKRKNPVAEMIKLPLKLEENTATLLLAEYDYEDDEDMEDVTDSEPSDSEDEDDQRAPAKSKQAEEKRLRVDIDLALSGWSNARQYYDQQKAAATKQSKTQQASQKALKNTEQRITADLKKGLKQEKAILRPVRKQMWFEKFIYFISSDGYLVLGGKDAQQSEILYRRYLKAGDVYVHADLQGAASVIIKNQPGLQDSPIPPSTLSQAGNMSVCTSTAWDSKAVMSAWWVNADQVSKKAPTGEYLPAGGFTIHRKKNFLPPVQLLLGFAVMFLISEESKARHYKNRLGEDVTAPKPAETLADDNQASDDDTDDDFPNAANDTAEDDDEFPDVKEQNDGEHSTAEEDAGSSSESDEERIERHANPFQSSSAASVGDGAAVDGNGGLSTVDAEVSSDVETVNEADSEHGPEGEDADQASGVRHLSAKERRQQKNGAAGSTQVKQENSTTNNKTNKAQTPASTTKPNHPSRGKRSKAKRAAAKYADQDEEDKQIAMALLGSRVSDEQKEAEAAEKAAKAESAEAAKERRRAQHEKAQKEGLEAEEMRRLNLDDGGVEELDEDEAAAMMQLDALVGAPLPGDEILEAIPVCAPWSALAKYKYKVKLQPGAQKKGKAVREIMGRWTKAFSEVKYMDQSAQDKEKIWPREGELVKGWKEAEIVGVVPVSKVRVMLSGGASSAGGNKSNTSTKKGGRGGKGSKKR